jgi:hypothetical protein
MKQTRVLVVLSLAILLAACSKDKFQTTPVIEIKSYSSKSISTGQVLSIHINYFDKEGDLGKGQLMYIRYRTNSTPIPNPGANDQNDTIPSVIPDFPPRSTGELILNLDYGFLSEDPNRNDTMYFKFVVTDIAGNRSDTVTSESLVAREP